MMELRRVQQGRIRGLLWGVVASILVSVVLGGYWFNQVLGQLGSHARQEAAQLLELEDVVTDAVTALSGQTQEWKDGLLRAHDAEKFALHNQAFHYYANEVQQSLHHAELLMQKLGMNIADLRSFQQEHYELIASYESALILLDAESALSFRAVDERVSGKDRKLREGLNQLRKKIDEAISARALALDVSSSERALSTPFLGLGLLAILLPLISLAAFFMAYRSLREIAQDDARARAIYESIADAVLVADIKGRILSINATAQQLMGLSQEAARGKPIADTFKIYSVNTLQRVESPAERVLKDGQPIPMANGMLLRRLDGSEVAIEDSAAPVLDEHGNLFAVVMVFHDVTSRYEMLKALKRERELFQQTFDLAAVGMAHLGVDGKWKRVNRKLCEITGYSEAELLALSFQGVTHPDDLQKDNEKLRELLTQRVDFYHTEKRYIRKDGQITWISLAVSMVWKEDGSPDYGISIIEDIQSRKIAEQLATAADKQFQALFEQMPEGVLLIDKSMRVLSCNREALNLLGYNAEEMRALHVWDIDVIDDEVLVQQRAEKMRTTGKDDFESRYRTRDGHEFAVDVSVQLVHLPDGGEVFQTLFRDITDQKQASLQIEHLAYHDQLTGLANRRLLQDRLAQAINSVMRRDARLAVLFLDLDHFKDVNDSLGHQTGDALLQQVAQRLQKCIRAEDTLARVGGDEFVIMLKDVPRSEDAAAIAEKILGEIAKPLKIGNEELRVTPSLGISICPQDGRDVDNLLKHADAAMYQAKQSGRATYRFYTEELHEKALERLKIERLLNKALEKREFELYYQPKVDLSDGGIVGCEALIRWNHTGMGQVSPAYFIPIAEHSNLIVEIGEWVMREACRQAKVWQDQGRNLNVSFNVSARQFMRPDELLSALRRALDDSGVNPALMEIEITESLLIEPQGMSELLHKICAMGIHIALDDFGTGFSSLAYLRRFPISVLKIDRSFVSTADQNGDDAEMVKTIIGMAHNLRMSLVAEGVETSAQNLLLTAQGCEVAQGFFYSRPVTVAEFERLLPV